MRFDPRAPWRRLPPLWVRSLGALLWLVGISFAHYSLNYDHGEQRMVRMGYMPVITNLAAPLLDYTSQEDDGVRFKALKFSSFAEMGEALRNKTIDVGFMIAPLPIVLRQQGVDVKVVAIGNRHESTLVARKGLNARRIEDLAGKTVAVPMRFSGHNLAIHRLLEEKGLLGQVKVVEMNPPDMAAGLAAGSLDAYFVGEPFAAKSVKAGLADPVLYVEDYWPRFMCNVMVTRRDFIEQDPKLVQRMVQAAARVNAWAGQHRAEAAKIAARYWSQPEELVLYAMDTPPGRVRFDMFAPVEQEYQQMADLMQHFGLLEKNDIRGLVDDRFAKAADVTGVTDDLRSAVK